MCLGRVLILDDFNGFKNHLSSIEFKCICKKGTFDISIANYITILNSLLIDTAQLNQAQIKKGQEHNLSDELTLKLLNSVKKKKKNLKHKSFEEFSKFLNTLESNLLKLFQDELTNTIKELDKCIKELTKLKENFITKMDMKLTKINSMFVILKMVFFNLYKDFDNLNDMINLKFLSQIKTEFYKIKFSPNIDSLQSISNDIKNFENTEHFQCKFIFAAKPQNVLSWKTKLKLKDMSSNHKIKPIILSLAIVSGGNIALGTSDNVIKVYDMKMKKIIMNLIEKDEKEIIKPIRKLLYIGGNVLIAVVQNEIVFWNLKQKEIIKRISENKGIIITDIKEYSTNQIIISNNEKCIKVFSLSNYNCVFALRNTELCYAIHVNLKNSHVFLGFSNGDVTLYDNIGKESIICERNFIGCNINNIIEWKGKALISSNEPDIKIWDYKDKKSSLDYLRGHNKGVTRLQLFDYKSLLSCSLDGEVRMWDLIKMKCLFIIREHSGWVMDVIKCSNGMICSCGADSELRIMNYE